MSIKNLPSITIVFSSYFIHEKMNFRNVQLCNATAMFARLCMWLRMLSSYLLEMSRVHRFTKLGIHFLTEEGANPITRKNTLS